MQTDPQTPRPGLHNTASVWQRLPHVAQPALGTEERPDFHSPGPGERPDFHSPGPGERPDFHSPRPGERPDFHSPGSGERPDFHSPGPGGAGATEDPITLV